MHRLVGIILLLSLSLPFGHPGTSRSQASGISTENARLAQDRLVVFEGFLRAT
jgi:hypothetical protein